MTDNLSLGTIEVFIRAATVSDCQRGIDTLMAGIETITGSATFNHPAKSPIGNYFIAHGLLKPNNHKHIQELS
jgi:hypothetical protein